MKKTLFSAAVIAAFGVAAFASNTASATNTITFSGALTATTCTVTGGTNTSASVGDFTVNMPTVSVTSLPLGATAGDTPFSVVLSGAGCTNGKVANMWYETALSPQLDASSGMLKNTTTAGNATNVEVGLLNNAGLPINIATNSNPSTATIALNTATLKYTAFYKADSLSAVTAGPVSTSVVYSMVYN